MFTASLKKKFAKQHGMDTRNKWKCEAQAQQVGFWQMCTKKGFSSDDRIM